MDNEDLEHISRSLYFVANHVIGTPVITEIRRTTSDLSEYIDRLECELTNHNHVHCYSGSKAEGLRFVSSDEDWMYIFNDVKVIPPDSSIPIYDSNSTLLIMDNEMTKPGFTLLRVIGESGDWKIALSKVFIPELNGIFLSCKRWRELHTENNLCSDNDFTHGPCASGTRGSQEFDVACCLQCNSWPSNARDCVRRLQRCCWPSHDVLLSIVNDGVLFVPIGAKQSTFEDFEWRMSFSLAEKKLIYAMNHTQFLCYALLKIFLKEAIDVNPAVKGLLCSYFLKTALFWEISTTQRLCNPSSLLHCFWNCFRRILQWVNSSYCPNFFIPQNNMFEGKIEGQNQDKLLRHLTTLYTEGYSCLLECKSISYLISAVIQSTHLDLEQWICKCCIAIDMIKEFYNQLISALRPKRHATECSAAMKCLLLYRLATTTNNIHHRFLLWNWLYHPLSEVCMTEPSNSSAQGRCNRSHYRNLTQRLNVLQRSRTDSVSHILYQAIMCYNAGKYNQTLRLVQLAKEKVSSVHAIDIYRLGQNEGKYREAGGDNLPVETMMRKHILYHISINDHRSTPELYIEIHGTEAIQFEEQSFEMSPVLYMFFLQYFCHRRLGCQAKSNDTLNELSLFVHHNGQHLHEAARPLAWHILGICQQMNGDDWGACLSYLTALRQDIKHWNVASCIRLGTILVKYISNNNYEGNYKKRPSLGMWTASIMDSMHQA